MLDWISQSRLKEERKYTVLRPPHRGQLLRDYLFKRSDGETVMLTDFRGKWNLVIVALPVALDPAQAHLLQSLAEKSTEVREYETRVLVVTRPEHLPTVVNLGGDFIFLSDEHGTAMLELGASESPVIYITDKFREVFHRFHAETHPGLPTADDILGWVYFVAMQCPECHPPEWPADEIA